jgi:hypothetical protein
MVGIDAIRNEQGYDPAFAIGYVNKINEDQWSIAGKTIAPGQALCTSIAPEGEYILQHEYVPIVYSFEFVEAYPGEGTELQRSGHQHRIIDQGRRAQGYTGAPGSAFALLEILDKEGKPVSSDVLLDGLGVPLRPESFLFEALLGIDATINPNAHWEPFTAAPPGAHVITTLTGAKALIYRRHKSVPFNNLNL